MTEATEISVDGKQLVIAPRCGEGWPRHQLRRQLEAVRVRARAERIDELVARPRRDQGHQRRAARSKAIGATGQIRAMTHGTGLLSGARAPQPPPGEVVAELVRLFLDGVAAH